MNLSECLLNRDIFELGHIASFYECECNRNSKLELVQSIHHRMLNKSLYDNMMQHLEPSLLYFTTYILFQKKSMFSIDELVAKGKVVAELFQLEDSPRKWISALMKKGWLFPVSTTFQVQLSIPSDLQGFLKKRWMKYWKDKYEIVQPDLQNHHVRNEGHSILYDIHAFLSYILEHPLPLTLDGVIYKRHQQALIRTFHVEEELLDEKQWRFGYGRRFPSYPNRFALVYDFCFYKGWVKENGDQVYITYAGEEMVKKQKLIKDSIHNDLFSFWLKMYSKPISTLPFVTTFIFELVEDEWMEMQQLFTMTAPWLKAYYFDDKQTIFRERVIQMLIHLGVLQVSVDLGQKQTYIGLDKKTYTSTI